MSDLVSGTYGYLLANYGPLLTLKHVAELMHATPNGVRMAIARRRQPFAVALAVAQRKLGRRTYFEARRVAAVIDHEVSSTLPCERTLSGKSAAADASALIRQGHGHPTRQGASHRCAEMD